MMSLIFLLVACAMINVYRGKKRLSYGLFFTSMIVGLFWFHHHATSQLDILL